MVTRQPTSIRTGVQCAITPSFQNHISLAQRTPLHKVLWCLSFLDSIHVLLVCMSGFLSSFASPICCILWILCQHQEVTQIASSFCQPFLFAFALSPPHAAIAGFSSAASLSALSPMLSVSLLLPSSPLAFTPKGGGSLQTWLCCSCWTVGLSLLMLLLLLFLQRLPALC